MPIRLAITGPDGLKREMTLERESIMIGTDPTAAVRLADDAVSAVHAMIKIHPGGSVTVVDLASGTGTMVGGQTVVNAPVPSGAVIKVGRTSIQVDYPANGGGPKVEAKTQAPFEDEPTRPVSPAELAELAMKAGSRGSTSQPAREAAPKTAPAPKPAPVSKPPPVPQKPALSKAAAAAAPAPQPPPVPKSAPAASVAAAAAHHAEAHSERAFDKAKVSRIVRRFKKSEITGTLEERSANATRFFLDPLPDAEKPTLAARELQVTQLWGDCIIESIRFLPAEQATIGSVESDFQVWTDGVGARFVLTKGTNTGFQVNVPDGARIAVASGGKEIDLGSLAQTEGPSRVKVFDLGLEERALLSVGDFTMVLRQVAPSKRAVVNPWEEFDFDFSRTLTLVVLFAITMISAFFITPLRSESLSEDLFKNANRYAKYMIKAQEKPKKKLIDLSGVKEGAKAKDDEGKFGKKDAQKKEADPSKKGAPQVNANKREEDRKKVMSQLSWLQGGGADGAASNIFGPGGLGTGLNNALGGLQGGAGMGDAHGVGGLGSRGTGPGGGGTALGIGGLGTKGGGRGRGGYGSLDLGGRGKGDTQFDGSKTVVVGGLDKETIARVIKRHWNEIKYCYEKELSKDPNLYGKVTVNFIIDGTGTVSEASVQQTTMNNENVESCMLSHIRRWRFPEPKGGGEVIVTYPWVFKPAG